MKYTSTRAHPYGASDIFLIRQRLEGLAARLAAENFDSNQHPAQHELMRSIVEDRLVEVSFRQANRLFHDVILDLSQSDTLRKVIKSMVIPMQHIHIRAFVNEGYEQSSKQEHIQIARAILANDADTADALMQGHINNARLRIQSLKILAQ